jgi:hypothetical protein
MKKISVTIILAVCIFSMRAQQQVSFSLQAHQDDWQLFMSEKIISDLASGGKVVFITLTGGDEGYGISPWGSSTVPYYLAKENGSVYSSKFANDITATIGATPAAVPIAQISIINGHKINKYVYGNTVNYFLHLPDGNNGGEGFSNTGYQSLQRLNNRNIKSISSIDGLTKYTSWSDLTNTIKSIINIEKGADNQVWIYTASLDNSSNPNDHSDHIYSSKAAQTAVSNLPWVGIIEFVDYQSSALSGNLNLYNHQNAAAIFGLFVWGLIESKYPGTFEATHKSWLPMDYLSIKRSPQ